MFIFSRKKTRAVFLSLLLLAVLRAALPGAIDDRRFQNLTVEDGLSQNTVNCILRDRNGFMWFGTEEGLNRWDGYTFKVYRHCRRRSDCLAHDRVNCLLEDRDGSLWIGTNGGGLDRFDVAREHFSHLRFRGGDERSLSNDTVWAILPEGDGTFWIGTQNGLNHLDGREGKVRRYLYSPERSELNSGNTIYALLKDDDGLIWIGTGAGLVRFDPGRGTFVRFRADGRDAAGRNQINALFDDGKGTLWLGSEDGLGSFSKAGGAFQFKSPGEPPLSRLYHGRILNFFHAADGRFWVACEAGLYAFPRSDLLSVYFRAGALPQRLLRDHFVLVPYQDPAGILWAGSFSGIFKYDLSSGQFAQVGSELTGRKESVPFFPVTAISQDGRGRLWLGTYKKGLFGFMPGEEEKRVFLSLPGDDPLGRETTISVLCVDGRQVLWIGTTMGLYAYDIEKARFLGHYRAGKAPGSLSHDSVTALLADGGGRLWVGTENGLNLFQPRLGTFTAYRNEALLPKVIGGDCVTALCRDREGAIWVGTYGGGLSRFDPAAGAFSQHYRHRAGEPSSLGSDRIYCLLEDRRGRLWVGTNSGGLNLLDRSRGRFSCYTTEDGLPNNSILGLLEDRQGQLWLSTSRGLCQFSPSAGVRRNFTYRDGLQGEEFLPRSYFHGAGDEMFFGGAHGMTSFFPGDIQVNPHAPPVVITAVSILGRGQNRGGDLGRLGPLQLQPGDSTISFAFAALSFSDPQRNRYAYKIDGLNSDWIQVGNRHEITLSNLQPGSYTFRVKGSNHHGVWNERGAALAFTMRPHWWQAWWFRLPAFLLLLFAFLQWNGSRVKRMAARIRTEASMESFFEKRQISQREREIVHLLLKGKSNKEIEDALFIAMGTVKNHVTSVYQKIGVKNRAQLLALFKNLQVK